MWSCCRQAELMDGQAAEDRHVNAAFWGQLADGLNRNKDDMDSNQWRLSWQEACHGMGHGLFYAAAASLPTPEAALQAAITNCQRSMQGLSAVSSSHGLDESGLTDELFTWSMCEDGAQHSFRLSTQGRGEEDGHETDTRGDDYLKELRELRRSVVAALRGRE